MNNISSLSFWLKTTIFVSVLIVLLTPLIVMPGMFFPYIGGKAILLRIFASIGFFSWITLAIINKQYRPKITLISISMVGLIVVALISALTGVDTRLSLWSNFERMEGWWTLVHVAMLFLTATSVFDSNNWKWIWRTSLVVSVIVSINALSKFLPSLFDNQLGLARPDSSLGNSTYLSVYALFHAFLAGWLVLKERINWYRWALAVYALIQLFLIVITQTRGTALGLAVAALFVLIFFAIKARRLSEDFNQVGIKVSESVIRNLSVVIIITGLVIGSGLFLSRNSEFAQSNTLIKRFTNFSLTEGTIKHRLVNWEMALQGFQERPIFGWGQENYSYVFAKYYDLRMFDAEPWFDRTHNIYLDWLVTTGIVGFVLYLLLCVGVVIAIWRKEDFSLLERVLFTSLFIAYFIHNAFVFDNLSSYMLFALTLAMIDSGKKQAYTPKVFMVSSPEVQSKYVVVVSGLVCLIVMGYVNLNPLRANVSLLNAIKTNDVLLKQELFEKAFALSKNSTGVVEISEQYVQQAMLVKNSALPDNVKIDFIQKAGTAMQYVVNQAPDSTRERMVFGSFLSDMGNFDQAIANLEKAREISTYKAQINFVLTSVYLRTGQIDKAIEVSKEFYERIPEMEQAKQYYAISLIASGKIEEGEKLGGENLISNPFLIFAYDSANRYDRVIPLLEAMVAQSPANDQLMVSLAAAYFKIGDKVSAIDLIKKVMARNESFKTQGEALIKSIQAGEEL